MAVARSIVVKVDPQRTALFLCDIQERFSKAIHHWDHLVATAHKILKAASILDLPVYATEQAPKALGGTVFYLKTLLPSPAIAKTRFSMFLPDTTPQWLESANGGKGVSSVIIFGIESHVCVLQTTLDLLSRDIDVHVLADGISSCNAGERRLAFERMRQAGAQITTSESILFQLLEDASHPNFKAILTLIMDEKAPTAEAVRVFCEEL